MVLVCASLPHQGLNPGNPGILEGILEGILMGDMGNNGADGAKMHTSVLGRP